jgi:hypothetical protein
LMSLSEIPLQRQTYILLLLNIAFNNNRSTYGRHGRQCFGGLREEGGRRGAGTGTRTGTGAGTDLERPTSRDRRRCRRRGR